MSSLPANTHDATNYGPTVSAKRGNPTEVARWLNTGGSIISTAAYDETGQIISSTDPCGNSGCSDVTGTGRHATTYSYTDSPSGDNAAGNSNAYPTQITDPLGHVQAFTYNYTTGELATFTDPNSKVTSYTYVDPLNRLTGTTFPDGGATNISYQDSVTQWGGTNGSSGARLRSFTYDSLGRLGSSTNPESGVVSYTYDANSNLASKTDARNIATQYTYDSDNRLTAETATGISYVYTYDSGTNGVGRLTAASNLVNADEVFSYDSMGRIISQASWTPSSPNNTSIVTTAKYDLAGNLTDLTYPDGRHITQQFDGAAHLTDVVFADWNGTSVNYPYASSISYSPSGSVSQMTLGDGVIQTFSLNTRLQDCEIKSTFPATPGSSTMQSSFDKQYYFGPGTGMVCGAASGNNGDIARVTDALSSARTQSFQYDSLNRITGAVRADNIFNYSYAMDGFGNMNQINKLTGNPAVSFLANNQMQMSVSAWTYDAAGNLTSTGQPAYGGSSFTFDSEGQLTQVNSGSTATYTYDAEGQRIRKDTPSGWTEYIDFGGRPIAEKNANGTWSDYVFANGQRLAEADSNDERIHLEGTTTVAGHSAAWYLPFSGYVIQNGDKVFWRQYQTGGAEGGLSFLFTDDTCTNWTTLDSSGDVMNSDVTQGVWHERSVDLSSFANKTVGESWIGADVETAVGSWNSYFADIAIVSANGTVTPIYYREPSIGLTFTSSGDVTNTQAFVEVSNTAGDSEVPQYTTTYYAGDSLGTTRMQFAAGGWPVWQGDFAPYGEEINAQQTSNHYNFTGKERDTESGNDYFGARYYASSVGRFMSPDWSAKAQPVPYAKLGNPQTLNLYGYMQNNPLGGVDQDGHCDWCQKLWNEITGNGFITNAQASAIENEVSTGRDLPYKVTSTEGEGTLLTNTSSSPAQASKLELGPGMQEAIDAEKSNSLVDLGTALVGAASAHPGGGGVGPCAPAGLTAAGISSVNDSSTQNLSTNGTGAVLSTVGYFAEGTAVGTGATYGALGVAAGTTAWSFSNFISNIITSVFAPPPEAMNINGTTIQQPELEDIPQ